MIKIFGLGFFVVSLSVASLSWAEDTVTVTGYRNSGASSGASPSGSAVSYSYTNYASIAAGQSAGEAMAAAVKAKECAQKKEQNAANAKTCEFNARSSEAIAMSQCESKYSVEFDYTKCTKTANAEYVARSAGCIADQAQQDANISACR